MTIKRYMASLARAREKMGKWSEVTKLKTPPYGLYSVPNYKEIDSALKGMDYFKFGIKPRVEELGHDYFIEESNKLCVDIITYIRHHFGIKISKSYNYCKELGFDLPIDYHYDDADKFVSDYIKAGCDHSNDCSVRTFSRMLDISYDESLYKLSQVSDKNAASEGTDSNALKEFCIKYGLVYFSDAVFFNGKRFANLTPYELYYMIPLLKHENVAIGVYRHIFSVNKGVIYDHRNYAHKHIDFIICKSVREETFKRLFKKHLRTCLDIKVIAYEKWIRSASWNTIAFDLRMKPNECRACAGTLEYRNEIKTLMYNWRSKEEFIDWISTYNNVVERLSKRFSLEEDSMRNIIRIVQEKHGIDHLLYSKE